MKKSYLFISAFFLLLSLSGVAALSSYSSKPGLDSEAEVKWPQESKLSTKKEFRLVMFIHPGCPCSKASLEELSKVQGPNIETTIVILEDPMFKDMLQNNPLVKKAKSLKHANVVVDHMGHEAKLFGAKTSGATFLYQNSNLVFSGGVTVSRGHVGDSEGLRIIKDKLANKSSSSWLSRVYGCGLFNGKKS